MIKLRKIKQVSLDFFYNILASAVLTGTMQIIVYPLLAKWVSLSDYGTIVTAMGLINTVVGALGTALNNTRLIMNSCYNSKKAKGDFKFALIFAAILSFIILTLIGLFFLNYPLTYSLLIGFISILMVCRQYWIVDYRLRLNFKKILFCNLFGAIGYIIGIILFYIRLRIWPVIFLCSELCFIVYIVKSSVVWKESYHRTELFKPMMSKALILLVSVLFGNLLTYFDRIFLYPTLGSESVSIYTVASFFGKSLAIVMTPISGVLLGYFAQDEYMFSRSKFIMFDALIAVVSAVFAIIAVIISPIITSLLYPEIYLKAESFVFIANTSAILAVSCNMLQTVILKFSPTYFQILKEFLYAFLYFTLSIILMQSYGLMGFCVAALFSNLAKYIVISAMGLITFRKENG